MSNPRRWSLRARLLGGLIAVTAIFLIVMGTVTTVVLHNLEGDQFSTDLSLTAKQNLDDIIRAGQGTAPRITTRCTARPAFSTRSPCRPRPRPCWCGCGSN